MSANLSGPLREAIIGLPETEAALGQWKGEPSVHTRRPAPKDATYPMVIVSPDVAVGDIDGLTSRRPVLERDVIVYGQQPRQYRKVEDFARVLQAFFHRNRFAIAVPGFRVVEIVARGPIPAPTDDDKTVARAIPLTITLKDLST